MLQEEWGKPSRRHVTPTPTLPDVESSHDEHDVGAAGVEDAAESDRQSAGSQPKKTKVRSDLTDEEEEAMADWLGDHPCYKAPDAIRSFITKSSMLIKIR